MELNLTAEQVQLLQQVLENQTALTTQAPTQQKVATKVYGETGL